MTTRYREAVFISPDAGVVKLVDAGDSKSPGPCAHVGSIPTSGTNESPENLFTSHDQERMQGERWQFWE